MCEYQFCFFCCFVILQTCTQCCKISKVNILYIRKHFKTGTRHKEKLRPVFIFLDKDNYNLHSKKTRLFLSTPLITVLTKVRIAVFFSKATHLRLKFLDLPLLMLLCCNASSSGCIINTHYSLNASPETKERHQVFTKALIFASVSDLPLDCLPQCFPNKN